MTDSSNNGFVWTPANIVTVIRILGVPLFVAALLSPWPNWFPQFPELEAWKPWIAVILFVILACTDSLDGYLARSRNEVTTFGKFVDPLADKILVAAALLAMIELDMIPSWVALIILTREFIVSGLRMLAAAEGQVIAASWYGKAKTVTQIIAIILFLVKDICLGIAPSPSDPLYIVAWAFMIVAVILTIVSMVDYFIKCMPMLGFSKKDSKQNAKESAADMTPDEAPSHSGDLNEDTASYDDEALSQLAERVIKAAQDSHQTVATAESLTGGMISQYLTSIPGSSSVVLGGVASYAYSVKENVLGVSHETLESQGAVLPEVAEQMARGCKDLLNSDVVVSVTGIAGPGGEEPGKPVGTVWMGLADAAGVQTRRLEFAGDRDAVRRQTTKAALESMLASMQSA